MNPFLKYVPKKIYPILKTLYGPIKILRLIKNYIYDFKRYLKYSTTLSYSNDANKLESRIIKRYHIIEKGLAMPETRLGFGQAVINQLIEHLSLYKKKNYPTENIQYKAAISALNSYIDFHEVHNYDVNYLKNEINKLNYNDENDFGGVVKMKAADILTSSKSDFKNFALNRFSIRKFDSKEVSNEAIEEVIRIAQKTPSVCNRQSSKVYVVEGSEKVKEVLSLQNGNRGFGHLINKVLIITSDIRAFDGFEERNQSFIDGGMFAMSVLYGLHYQGLGACALNWSVKKETHEALRKMVGVGQSENIIMYIGVGHLPSELEIPISQRKTIEEVVTYIR
jgi:nitroreductase